MGNHNFIWCLALCIVLAGCSLQEAEQVEAPGKLIQGDLYFKLISAGSLYGADKEKQAYFRHLMDSLQHLDNPSESEADLVENFSRLEQWGVLYMPYFHLRTSDGKIHLVYLDEADYARVKMYSLRELEKEQMKVEISLQGEYLSENVIRANEVMKIQEIAGTTHWRK